MSKAIQILLQTTIPSVDDDWTIDRFSLLADPHEGSVGAPEGEDRARVIATGVSQTTGRDFNLIVAFERTDQPDGGRSGRAIAESSFHHFVDYNWDTCKGCPSFLTEPLGDEIERDPLKLNDVRRYVSNAAKWLSPAN